MQFFGINIPQIVFPVIVFPTIAFGGFLGFQQAGQQAFVPQTIVQSQIQPRQIEQRQIQQQTLSPVSNLVGDWNGAIRITNVRYQDNDTCEHDYQMALHITNQNGNDIAGNSVATWQSGTRGCAPSPTINNAVHGTISGSSLQINIGSWGDFAGSFTSNTMTLNSINYPGGAQIQPINLLR